MVFLFRPRGRDLVQNCLIPGAVDGYVFTGLVAEGPDIFSVSSDALYLSYRREHGEMWGYFFGPQPAAAPSVPVPGGRWFSYGPEKAYSGSNGGDVLAFRRRFRHHVMQHGPADGSVVWLPTRWLMTEFRLNKNAGRMRAASFKAELGLLPDANLDRVVRKVFTKPAVPQPPPPPPYSDDESTGSNNPNAAEQRGYLYSGEDLATKRARLG